MNMMKYSTVQYNTIEYNAMRCNTKHSRRILTNVNKTHFIEREPRQREFNRIEPNQKQKQHHAKLHTATVMATATATNLPKMNSKRQCYAAKRPAFFWKLTHDLANKPKLCVTNFQCASAHAEWMQSKWHTMYLFNIINKLDAIDAC